MSSIVISSLLCCSQETVQCIRKYFDLDKPGKMDEAVTILEGWIKMQNHFRKKDFNRNFLEMLIIQSKGSLERAKARLDKYCTLKTILPKYFEKTDPETDFKSMLQTFYCVFLPKLVGDYYRVYMVKINNNNLTSATIMDYYRLTLMMAEYILSEDYFNGYVLVADFTEVNIADFLAAINLVELSEALKLYTESLGLRMKSFHFVTPSKMVHGLVTLLRQFLSQKLGNRIHVYKDMDSLFEVLPKDAFPEEYGGKANPLETIRDIHSQDEIVGAFAKLEKEICVKFFNTPVNYNATEQDKILYISNPDKRKTCPPDHYDYSKNVVDMSIGYKCINQRDIARIVVDMLRASIEETVSIINSYDLIKKFQQREQEMKRTKDSLLSPNDRNYINAHYHSECGAFSDRSSVISRRTGIVDADSMQLSESNEIYYAGKRWPLGLVMYDVEKKLRGTPDHSLLKYAMTSIELYTCVVFQDIQSGDNVLTAKNYLWFGSDGEDAPQFGFREGKQALKLESITHGAPGHTAHAIINLMRALGVPMMSNRFDRNNYVAVNWNHVQKGKEHYLEKEPQEAWVLSIPYDFNSVTHAPANFMCADCILGAQSVQPLQDHLWQRTMSMGHKTDLSEHDIKFMEILYNKECQQRLTTKLLI